MGISEEELKRRVPSVYSDASVGQASEKYLQIKTSDVLSLFLDIGWEVQTATEINVRSKDRKGFQKHMLILEHPSMIFQDEGKLNVVIRNFHDRSNSLEIFYGFMRFACSNQLFVRNLGNDNQKSFHHHKANLDTIKDWVAEILFGFNDLSNDIRFLKAKVLNQSQIKEFANTALDYRFQSDLREYRRYLADSILKVRRNEDDGNTAWKVLNRVQETIIKGLAYYPDKNKYMRYIKCRPIQGMDRLISFNTDLWQLAKEI
ncbi:DUF932 domain-containing protein [Leptospira santarosai]|uniref:DUF932 domain-containing protein n=1 Tax=Leptospira santarosai TaxID=28183 RepID=UPI0002BDE7A2|nr:DUF932 domain-containing protein [Leptospira santarosai]EMO73341.1 PF06067 domain protein [Leptospira santarosai str. 200403458]EMO96906.1 PF06067 domain protein [Leptospira santarosai str. 200702252]